MNLCVLIAAMLLVQSRDIPEPKGMKGVKTCTVCVFEPDSETKEETLFYKKTITYNEHGDIVSVLSEVGRTDFTDSYSYEYDGKNRIVSCEHRWEGVLSDKYTITYAADGGFTKFETKYTGVKGKETPVRSATYEYTPKGLLKSQARNSAKGPPDPRFEFTYDDKGRVTIRKMFVASSPFPEITTHSYDDRNGASVETVKHEDQVHEEIMRVRNAEGDVIRAQYFDAKHTLFLEVETGYAYDSEGRPLIKSESRRQGSGAVESRNRRTTYQYELFEKK